MVVIIYCKKLELLTANGFLLPHVLQVNIEATVAPE